MSSIADVLRAVALTCDAWFRPCRDVPYDWVCLNDASPLTKPVPLSLERGNRTLPGGQLMDWEWSRNPDYWDSQHPWRGYIPQLDSPVSLGPHAWVFIFDGAPNQVVQDPLSTPVYLLESVQKNMRATCEIAANLRDMVLSQYGTPRFKPPPAPATNWIPRPHGVTKMLLDKRWESRREILDILGFTLYALALDPEWRLKAWPPAFFKEIDRWQLSSSHRRGVIVDPASIQSTSIIDFVRNRVPVHYPWRDEWTSDPPHMLDPYSFTTHRFDLWERSGGPSSAEDKSSALLQRPPPPIPQSTPTDGHSWVTEAMSTQSNPWHPKPPARRSSVHSAPPTGKHVVKAKERVYTVPEEGGPRTLVKTKAEAKRLKNDYITIKESRPEGDICIVLLDRPSDEDSDDEVYPVGANFNIPQNVGNETQTPIVTDNEAQVSTITGDEAQVSMITGNETQVSTITGNEAQVSMIKGYRETTDGRMDVEAPPIPVATSPLRPTSPASENEVIVWDDRDGPPPPDELTPAPHQAAPMEIDVLETTTTPRDPSPAPKTSPRRKSWSPRRLSPSSTRRPRSPDQHARPSSYRPRSPPRGRTYDRGRGEPYHGRTRMDSYVPAYSSRERTTRDRSRSPLRRQHPPLQSSRSTLGDRISTHTPQGSLPPRSITPSSVSSLSISSAVPAPPQNDTRPSLLARIGEVTTSLPTLATPHQQAPPSLDLRRQQAAAFLQDCFRQGPSPFASPPFPVNGITLPPAPIQITTGKLIVPPSTELRIRYWWLQNPDLSMATLMQECLRKGLPFRMVVPEDNLRALRPQGLLPNYNRPSWLDNSDALIPQGRREPANTRILQDYLRNVTAVLQRPHARRFLTTGDLLWRIAIAFGPATLYADALTGPSSTASVYGRHSPPVQNNLVDDLLMPTEITTLLGVTELNQSFWPPLELFRDSQHFNGEWSPTNEEWFDRHARKILAGDASALTPQKQWKTHFRRRGTRELPALAIVGTMDHAQSSQDTLLSSFPDIWDSYNAIDIARASL
jgi:hypothetical protein